LQTSTDINLLVNLLNDSKGQHFVLCDENTYKHCYPIFSQLIGKQIPPIIIQTGEEHKSIATCELIWQKLLKEHADKHTVLINLGGGVISDIGGFVAASYKRGINFVNVPTSLLAMVDAAFGGKTGINFMHFKNIIGLIYLPKMVILHTPFLNTLPQKHILNGFAEMIKHALIANNAQFEWYLTMSDIAACINKKSILESLAIKENIVAQDLTEKKLRKALNFGHTLGHAIEFASQQKGEEILHGEAVAIGMIAALKLSVKKLGFEAHKAKQIMAFILKYYHIPQWLKGCENDIFNAVIQDKKNREQQIRMVLLQDIADPKYDIKCTLHEIEEVWKEILNL
jgi:3-dehydroquinate synthase